MNEFELIQTYFQALPNTKLGPGELGIGDDCALLSIPPQHQLAVSTDTLVAGVHFPTDSSPADIGYKALAVNLSDLAAMGARPAWFTLCVTLPAIKESWIAGFCQGLSEMLTEVPIALVGGDTTRGPLSISVQVMGWVQSGQALRRQGAKPGDDIYVSGKVGEAGAGLRLWQEGKSPANPAEIVALQRLTRPQPRVALGQRLLSIASACIDVSDGLCGDLNHLLTASGVGAGLNVSRIPLADYFAEPSVDDRQFASNAGDDYELCFTAPPSKRAVITEIADELDLPLTRIGEIIEAPGLNYVGDKNTEYFCASFHHF